MCSKGRYLPARHLWKELRKQPQFSDHRSLSAPCTSSRAVSRCPVPAAHPVNSYRLAHLRCHTGMVSVSQATQSTFAAKLRCRRASGSAPATPAPFGACLRPISLVRSSAPSSTVPLHSRELSRHPSLSTIGSTCSVCPASPFRWACRQLRLPWSLMVSSLKCALDCPSCP